MYRMAKSYPKQGFVPRHFEEKRSSLFGLYNLYTLTVAVLRPFFEPDLARNVRIVPVELLDNCAGIVMDHQPGAQNLLRIQKVT